MIKTWKQYDNARNKLGCEAEYTDVHGDTATCIGNPCDECGRNKFCPKCYELLGEVEDFEQAAIERERARYQREKRKRQAERNRRKYDAYLAQAARNQAARKLAP